MEIHVRIQNQQYGPFSIEEIRRQLASGHLRPIDEAWHDGLPDWVTVKEVLGASEPLQVDLKSKLKTKVTQVYDKCPACSAPIQSTDEVCFRCTYQLDQAGKGRGRQRPVDTGSEEFMQKSRYQRLGVAMAVGCVLPASIGTGSQAKLLFPNFDLAGDPVWLVLWLLYPGIAGIGVALASCWLTPPFRGIVGAIIGLAFIVPLLLSSGSVKSMVPYMDRGLNIFQPELPLVVLLFWTGWVTALFASMWRSLRPAYVAPYWIGVAGGMLILISWFSPLMTDSTNGSLVSMMIPLFKTSLLPAIGLLLLLASQVVASVFCAFSTRGKIMESILNLNHYSIRLHIGGLVVLILLLVVWWIQQELQVDIRGSQWLEFLLRLSGYLMLVVKLTLWIGGSLLLLPVAAVDLATGRAILK